MKQPQFTSHLRMRFEPELDAAIKQRARSERTSAAEWIRRVLRAALVKPPRYEAADVGGEAPVVTFDPRTVLEPIVALPFDDFDGAIAMGLRAPDSPKALRAYADFLTDEGMHVHESLAQMEVLLLQDDPLANLDQALGLLRQSHQHYQRLAAGVRGLAVHKLMQDGALERIETRIRDHGEAVAERTAALIAEGHGEDAAEAMALAQRDARREG